MRAERLYQERLTIIYSQLEQIKAAIDAHAAQYANSTDFGAAGDLGSVISDLDDIITQLEPEEEA